MSDCDKKIFPIQEELNELERKHLHDIIKKWKEDKKK